MSSFFLLQMFVNTNKNIDEKCILGASLYIFVYSHALNINDDTSHRRNSNFYQGGMFYGIQISKRNQGTEKRR